MPYHQPIACAPLVLHANVLRSVSRHWLGWGLALTILLPVARSYSQWIGWVPYWLVAAPLLCLTVLNGVPLLRNVGHITPAKARRFSRRKPPQATRHVQRTAARKLNLAALLSGHLPPGV